VRSWASSTFLGGSRRSRFLRVAAAVALFAGLLWLLPSRRADDGGGRHEKHVEALDAFEKAGITELKDGQRGPTFRLRTFPDDRHATLQDFEGKLVVLNFWATWCGPCTAEMPTLESLWQEYRPRGLVVLAISVDRGAARTIVAPYVTHHRLTFPILLDPDMTVAAKWRVAALPVTFIVKPGGDVVGMATGAREWNSREMRALLELLLPGTHASNTHNEPRRP
jgi:peroxiredoxin